MYPEVLFLKSCRDYTVLHTFPRITWNLCKHMQKTNKKPCNNYLFLKEVLLTLYQRFLENTLRFKCNNYCTLLHTQNFLRKNYFVIK